MLPLSPWPAAQSALWALSVLLALVSVGACWLGVVAPASASDFVWSGEGAANADAWSNVANWQGGGGAPASASSVGTLSFPLLNRSACLQANPNEACYTSLNNLTGLSVNQLQVDDSHEYSLGGDGFTLGSGGLTINASQGGQGRFSLTTPLALSSSQTWSITGPPTPSAWPAQGVLFGGVLSGENADLTVNLSSVTLLRLGLDIPGAPSIDDELGNLTINGTEAAIGESVGKYKSVVMLAPSATLNANDGHSLTLHDLEFEASSATGPITAVDSDLTLSGSSIGPVTMTHSQLEPNGLLGLPSLSLDATSVLDSGIRVQSSQPGTDYSEITSAGAVGLGGATLAINSPVFQEEGCPLPPVGRAYTLISTTGSLTGTFSNAPDGSTVVAYCPPSVVEGAPVAYFYRINYHTTSSPETVIATALPAIPTANTIEPQLPVISGAAVAGQTLSESHGAWANNPTGYVYQWQRCDSTGNNCQPITSATGQSYSLTATDVGSTIRVAETASNAEGTSTAAVSTPTAVVQAAPTGGQLGGGNGGGALLPPVSCCDGPAVITPGLIKALLSHQLVPPSKAAKIGALLKSGGYSATFQALEAGTLTVQWYEVPSGAKLAKKARPILVASGKLAFSGAGTSQLKIKLTSVGKRLLKHAKRLKLTAKGMFVPRSGTVVSATKQLVLGR